MIKYQSLKKKPVRVSRGTPSIRTQPPSAKKTKGKNLAEKRLIDNFLERPTINFLRHRKEVSSHLPKGNPSQSAVFDRIQVDLVLFSKSKIYVCEAKVNMNREAIGQALVAREVFKELHPDKEIVAVVLTTQSKPILKFAADKLGVLVVEVNPAS